MPKQMEKTSQFGINLNFYPTVFVLDLSPPHSGYTKTHTFYYPAGNFTVREHSGNVPGGEKNVPYATELLKFTPATRLLVLLVIQIHPTHDFVVILRTEVNTRYQSIQYTGPVLSF